MFDHEVAAFLSKSYSEYVFFIMCFTVTALLQIVLDKKGTSAGKQIDKTVVEKAIFLSGNILLSGVYVTCLRYNVFFSYSNKEMSFATFLCSIAISIIFGIVNWIILNCLLVGVKRLIPLIKRNIIGIGLFSLGCISLFYSRPDIEGWCLPWYAADYSMGIGPRFFIGSILKIIFGNYVTKAQVKFFWECNCVILIFLISYLANYLCRKRNKTCVSIYLYF